MSGQIKAFFGFSGSPLVRSVAATASNYGSCRRINAEKSGSVSVIQDIPHRLGSRALGTGSSGKPRREWEANEIFRPQSTQRRQVKRSSVARIASYGDNYEKSGTTYIAESQHPAEDERGGPVQSTPGMDQTSKNGDWRDGLGGVVWEADEIAQAVGGEVVRSGPPGSICTDSRRIEEGQWFIALVGPRFDGHQFLQQALDRGCGGIIGSVVSPDWPRGFVRVDDTLIALHQLAALVRSRYDGPVVGITGSTGKTTARAMTALALESLGCIHQTEGNLNNHIGVPLTILKLPSTASACVLEMGMNHAKEIHALAEIAKPSVRVLLNVGPAHMENFVNLEGVAAAKGELLSGARPGDTCVLNADDPLLMSLAIPPGVKVVFIGRQMGCHVRIVDVQATSGGRCVRVVLEHSIPASIRLEKNSFGFQIWKTLREAAAPSEPHVNELHQNLGPNRSGSNNQAQSHQLFLDRSCGDGSCTPATARRGMELESTSSPPSPRLNKLATVEFEIHSPGLHLALNACAAAAVAVSLGIPLPDAGKSLTRYSPIGMRCRWEDAGSIQIINDAYNSNPMSLEAALRSLRSMDSRGRRVAFLGDMLELGSVTRKAHMDALLLCQELELDVVGLAGPSFLEAATALGLHDSGDTKFVVRRCAQELGAMVVDILRPGDAVLIKGSRGTRMEHVAYAIRRT